MVMAFVAHYNLEIYQMDTKVAILDRDIDKLIYKVQPKNFESNNSNNLVCN